MKAAIQVSLFVAFVALNAMAEAPSAPSQVYANPWLTEIKINVSWSDTSNNETGFVICRNGMQIGSVGANVGSFDDTTNYPGFYNCEYQVIAVNESGESASEQFMCYEPAPSVYGAGFERVPMGIIVYPYSANAANVYVARYNFNTNAYEYFELTGHFLDETVTNYETYSYDITVTNAWGSATSYGSSVEVQPWTGAAIPTIQFELHAEVIETTEGPESFRSICIEADGSRTYPFWVQILTSGTAVHGLGSGDDFYTGTFGIYFNPGETRKYIPLTVLTDAVSENDETVILQMVNGKNCNITGDTQNIVIHDASNTNTDTTPPSLVFVSPGAGSFTSSLRPLITVGMSDSGTGVNTATLLVKVDGGTVSTNLIAGGIEYQPTSDLADGAHSLKVTVSDYAGNPSDVTWTFNVDATPPAVVVSTPTNTTEDYFPLIGVMYEDLGVGVDPESVQVLFNGNSIVPEYIDENFCFFYPEADLSDGLYTVSIAVSDTMGNTATNSWTFTVDTVTPVVRIYPVYGALPITWGVIVWQNRTDVTSEYAIQWDGGVPFGTQSGAGFTLQAGVGSGTYPIVVEAVFGGITLTANEAAVIANEEETGGEVRPAGEQPPGPKPVISGIEISNGRKSMGVSGDGKSQGLLVDQVVKMADPNNVPEWWTREFVALNQEPGSIKGVFVTSAKPNPKPNPIPGLFKDLKRDHHAFVVQQVIDILTGTNGLIEWEENFYEVLQVNAYKEKFADRGANVVPHSGFVIRREFLKISPTEIHLKTTKTPRAVVVPVGGGVALPSEAGLGAEQTFTIGFKKVDDKWEVQ